MLKQLFAEGNIGELKPRGSRGFYSLMFKHVYVEKLLDSDRPRAVQFKCNTVQKGVIPVQKV